MKNLISAKNMAYILLAFISCMWGMSFPVADRLLKEISTFQLLSIRYLLCAFILMIVFANKIKNIGKNEIKFGLLLGGASAIGMVLQMLGLERSNASNTGLIAGMGIIIVPIIEYFWDKKKSNYKTIFGIIISLAGLFIMSATDSYMIGIGEIICFISTVCFSFQIYFIGKTEGQKVDLILLTMIQLFIMGLFASPFLLIGSHPKINLSGHFIIYMGFLVLLPGLIAGLIQNKYQPKVPNTHATLIYLLEPVSAVIAAYFFGDKILLHQIVGSAIILVGVLLVIFASNANTKEMIIEESI